MSSFDDYIDNKIKNLQSNINVAFYQARKELDSTLRSFISDFNDKDSIHRKQVEDGEWTVDQYQWWVSGQVFQGRQWMAKRDQMAKVLRDSNEMAVSMINDDRESVFVESSNFEAYKLEHDTKANLNFTLFNKEAVDNLISKDPQILPKWKVDEEKDYRWNGKTINSVITQGILQGKKLTSIADSLVDKLESSNKNKMMMFARTGMTQAQNAGVLERLSELQREGISVHKEWLSTLDEHTRITHRHLDGQKQPLNKAFSIDGISINYPGDPNAPASMVFNCRCSLTGDIDDELPAEYQRRDNINGELIENMTYDEWEQAKKGITTVDSFQTQLGACKSVQEVNDLMNSQGWFRANPFDGAVSQANLNGCDLDSAKSVAAAYEQVFKKYPALAKKFNAPNANPIGMKKNTYAWCYPRNYGIVQVNPNRFNNWRSLVKSYNDDVESGWHTVGTTAESIVTHEIGHAVDGLLAREGILGGFTASGEYRYASSSLKNTIMKRIIGSNESIRKIYEDYKSWWGNKKAMGMTISDTVSGYATENSQEWFAECFAEYITSAKPRSVASEFGKELEKLLEGLK